MVGANGACENNISNSSNGQNGDHAARIGTIRVKQGLAQMLKGGVIVSRFNRIDINYANFELVTYWCKNKAVIDANGI